MLLEDCHGLIISVHKAATLDKYAKDLVDFRKRQEFIHNLVEEISSLAGATQAFKSRSIYKLESTQRVDQFLAEVATIWTNFSEDKGFIIGEEFKITSLNARSKSLKDFLDAELSEAWQIYKEKNMPPVSMELLDILEKISTFKPTVQKVKNIVRQLEEVQFPKSDYQFSQVDFMIADLSKAWDSLQSSEVPKAVLEFLKDTSTIAGASLESLTPEVEAWLKSKGIIHLFQIKLVG